MDKSLAIFTIDPEQIDQVRQGTLDLTGLEKAEKVELYLHW